MTLVNKLPPILWQAVRVSQARAITTGTYVAMFGSSTIALTTGAMLQLSGIDTGIMAWLAAVLVINLFRICVAWFARRPGSCERHAPQILLILSVSALVSGLIWAALPFMVGPLVPPGPNTFVIFVLVGTSAGSLSYNAAYAPTLMPFVIPPLCGVAVALALQNTPMSWVLSFEALVVLAVMLRTSFLNHRNFAQTQFDRLRSSELSDTLVTVKSQLNASNQQKLALSLIDPMTRLGNRQAFLQVLGDRTLGKGGDDTSFSLLVVDLDHFQAINDTMGHQVGDRVLLETATRLKDLIVPERDIFRLGGDEFAILCQNDDVAERVQSILSLSNMPIAIDDRQVFVSCSLGLAQFPEHGETAQDLFANADIALYAAKERGRRTCGVFDSGLKADIDRQHIIERDLDSAIGLGQIDVHFQPQIDLSNNRIGGFEALLRWTHDSLGPISPPEAVKAAAKIHRSAPLTHYVATKAAEFSKLLPGMGIVNAAVAINVSPREFSSYSLSAMMARVIEEQQIDPSMLEIEITEEAALDAIAVGDELTKLKSAGYRLAIDDFGMGHSSLAYIARLQVDRLKVDRSFVRDISTSKHNQAFISAINGIGKSLQIEIVVEGVESADDVEMLKRLGCRIAQGYHFGRPMSVSSLVEWAAERLRQSRSRIVSKPV